MKIRVRRFNSNQYEVVVGRLMVSIHRRNRARWFRHERRHNYLMLSIANPNVHSWWATCVYLYWV